MYTFAKLMDIFRVGRKIWCTNNASNSRLLATIAFNLATNMEQVKGDYSYTYSYARKRNGNIKLIMDGVNHPAFYETAMSALMKDHTSGIIYRRELNSNYKYMSVFYNKQNKYQSQTVSECFNLSGPRTFLTKKKMIQYFKNCCTTKVAQAMIADIILYDEDADRMDEMFENMDDRCDYPDLEPVHVEPDYSVNFVFDKETLLTNSAMAKNLAKSGRSIKGVLTTEEMQAKVDAGQTITCNRDDNVFFFSDDYCIGVSYLPGCLVPSSTVIPYPISPREEFPDGLIKNVQEYINLHHKNKKQMNTVDELIDYLNTTYSRVTETM